MSHIQGHPHPAGVTEHLDYIEAHLDAQGDLTRLVVVTRHRLQAIDFEREITIYTTSPGTGQRDLAAVLSATQRKNLQAILTTLSAAVTAADTPTDPAPPQPKRPLTAES